MTDNLNLNTEHILEVADAIENATLAEEGIGFNMWNWISHITDINNSSPLTDHTGHDCQTVCCIAGWSDKIRYGHTPSSRSPKYAQNAMGLTDEQADELFIPSINTNSWKDITAEQAVKTLRHLAKTGEVKWEM